MSQHGLIDGFFAFWALLTLWLCGKSPIAAALEFTRGLRSFPRVACPNKGSCVFVWIAIVLTLVTNRWLQFGRVSRELWVATISRTNRRSDRAHDACRRYEQLFHTYQLFVTKNYSLPYQIRTGDGPWQRYLVDLLLVSPVVVILAHGSLFQISRTERAQLFLILFVAGTYAVMCNVKYG